VRTLFKVFSVASGLLLSQLPLPTAGQEPAQTPLEASFRQFMTLASKSPTSYGFSDLEEASKSSLGRCYGFYSTTEWAEAFPRMSATDRANPEKAPEKVYEVNTPNGETRCTFVLARQPSTQSFKPVLLGRQDIAARLRAFGTLPDRERLVLILDTAAKRLLYVDAAKPESILEFR
jgi:hypothetical protein